MTTTEQTMGLFEHLKELRQRLFRAVLAWLVAIIAASTIAERLIAWLVSPLESPPIVLGPTEAPIIYFKFAIAAGFVIALPYIMYQIYSFVAPGLYPQERSVVLIGIPAVIVFFIFGALFTLRVLIPTSLPVLQGFLGDIVEATYTLESYVSFVTTLIVWMGVLFQTPLVVYVIARLGVLTPKQLSSARRIVWFLAAIFAAVVTPTTDPVTLLLVTGPFIALYELGLLLAKVAARQRRKAQAERMETEV
jgi:sec-independent protein translocase protein TatC